AMRDALARINTEGGYSLRIRIGLHTGPVVAGVIGKRKFIYDMWGDTVNVAFRMAADAPSGAVQVDLMTYRRLQHRFRFDEAQEVDIKGKGRMQVYRLVAPLEESARTARA
ncbi:MAG TPA: adenylate/guanylate cyclase domain-containing protein, partial [Usitatibacter sp.]|nr:adenylate/guanylate cyclase domain-containing protein [Usitatibacter sp.]